MIPGRIVHIFGDVLDQPNSGMNPPAERLPGQTTRSEPVFPPSGKRIPELDGLRGCAILLVLISHYFCFQIHFHVPGAFRFAGSLLSLGWTGVDLFFVLSGFLIGGILMDHRRSPNYYKTFYVRRFWRIIPIYALVCLSFWAAGGLLDEMHIARPEWLFRLALPWYSYATLTQNIWLAVAGGWFGANWLAVTWSLSIEEQFYLAAPFVIRLTEPARIPLIAGIIILMGFVMRELADTILLFVFPSGALTEYILMPCRMDGFAVGILLAWAMRNERVRSLLYDNRGLLQAGLGTGFLGVCVAAALHWNMFARPMWMVGYTWLACFYGLVLVYSILFSDSMLARVFRNRGLGWLGVISYCVYLIHQPVSGLCHWFLRRKEPGIDTWSDAGVTLLAFVLTLCIAWISWRFYEKPLIARGHRHKY